jgi:hypothetical protein
MEQAGRQLAKSFSLGEFALLNFELLKRQGIWWWMEKVGHEGFYGDFTGKTSGPSPFWRY